MTLIASAVTQWCNAGALAAAGVDVTQISLHQAREVTPEDIQNSTHVICLQDSHRSNLIGMLPAASEKAVLLNVRYMLPQWFCSLLLRNLLQSLKLILFTHNLL